MSFASSSSVKPTARRAAIFAIGKPVAFEARADERETRGFISMMTRRPVLGFTAHCTFEPPVAMPILSRTRMESSRIAWYSRSVSVCIGATVMESPVCTPIGSKFSMEQTITALPALSRITSISNSFHPMSDSSTRTSLLSEASSPCEAILRNSSESCAMPPPVPPRVKPGRMMSGHEPILFATASASSSECALPDFGISRPICAIASLKRLRSSARAIASAFEPIISTPHSASTPPRFSSIARLSAVCPPSVGRSASGRSLRIIAATQSNESGSMYVASAMSGSVITVAGLELTRTISYPSLRSAFTAWQPE